MTEQDVAALAERLDHGTVDHAKRWSGDTHDDLGGSVDCDATDALMGEAAATLRAQAAEIERLQDSLDLLRRQHAVTDQCLGNLLATIHRDGGHHRAENGDERSTEDAIGLWADLMAQGEKAESDARADLCDPMQDEQVKQLAGAAERLENVARQNTDDALEWERVCDDVRAALTAALATQEAPND